MGLRSPEANGVGDVRGPSPVKPYLLLVVLRCREEEVEAGEEDFDQIEKMSSLGIGMGEQGGLC